jgi:3,5-epimerase/4-reductase
MKKSKILICGGGFIGERLKETLGAAVTNDWIRTFEDAERLVDREQPAVLINGIGQTGKNNVDGCEAEKDQTMTANVFVPLLLAEACLRRGIKFVHISSGCIYHYDYKRDRPISETKVPDFFDLFYSRTKIYSERALEVLSQEKDILIARIRIPLDDRPHPKNILNKLIKYGKVIDIPNSVTYVPDFARAMKHLIAKRARGIYNVVNKGGMRYPEFMEVYRKYRPDFSYEVIDHRKLGLVRTNLLMSTKKLEATGFKVRPIREVYDECIQNYLKY